jgi:ribosomal protein S18 acetylase RimI-like enzyme
MEYRLRPAVRSDCEVIARAIALSSGGYAQIGWQERQADYPGLGLLEIGSRLYARDEPPFTWRNCTVAEADQPLGVMLAYGIDASYESVEPAVGGDDETTRDVFYPARMEVPDSWYICGMTIFEPWRGRGIGSRLLRFANEQAARMGYRRLSLIAFEQNQGSVRLYLRHGFRIVERRRIVAHAMIEYTGDALLMTASQARDENDASSD